VFVVGWLGPQFDAKVDEVAMLIVRPVRRRWTRLMGRQHMDTNGRAASMTILCLGYLCTLGE
jgi:hypothetical protein